jgi:hypothetical protein
MGYYVILKALLQLLNVESRLKDWHVPAAVSGLFA